MKKLFVFLPLLLLLIGCATEEVELPKEIMGKEGAPMVLVLAGEFQMGSLGNYSYSGSDEAPVHMVYLDAFYMDKYEVTNSQYARFLNEYQHARFETRYIGSKVWYRAVRHPNRDVLIFVGDGGSPVEKAGDIYVPRAGYEDYPVSHISWHGALAYAQYYGKRLPTEAEWEKAARGGLVGKKCPWGDELTHDHANYSGTGGKDIWNGTAPVGSFAPNGYGLYDMAGNVWEWCADWYGSGYYDNSPTRNPKGPNSGTSRVLRGGSWFSLPLGLRIADRTCARRDRNGRGELEPMHTSSDYGFRCARDAKP